MAKTNRSKIEELDGKITKALKNLDKISDTLKFKEVGKFKLGTKIAKHRFEKAGQMGIYYFEIKKSTVSKKKNWRDWVSDFEEKWYDFKPKDDKKYSTPLIYETRIKAHKEIDEWVPFYLGKSQEMSHTVSKRKNISMGRLEQHFNHQADNGTFSLKLNARENLKGVVVRVSVINFKVESYAAIAPRIESNLRAIYNPIVGKQ